ncbi:TlpA family protein disulfide reductase [Flavobacterium cupreum]|nr:TlpA disulfide reductase family protein [Flavobacterium cupreum]
MLKKIVLLSGLFLLFGYQYEPDTNFVIDMKQVTNDTLNLNFSYVSTELISLDRTPIFKEKVIKNYIGVPAHDSIQYYGNFQETLQFFYDLYKAKEYDKKDFLELVNKIHLDTLRFSNKPVKQGFISIVGFYKNRQFIMADFNRNQDFSDDIKYEFDINFRNKSIAENLESINKLPKSDYYYESHSKGRIQTYKRKIVLFPCANSYDRKIIITDKEAKYLSGFRFKDYWQGEQILNQTVYDFSYQALDNTFGAIYIKPKNVSFRKDEIFNSQFMHFTEDTIALGDGYYKIDSINRKISKLYLRKIKSKEEKYGQWVGKYFENRIIEDLDNGTFSTDVVIKEKKYTLIDFWGTWCGPCLDMTPRLVALHNKYPEKLSIISIANDQDKNVVKQYAKKSKMNWTHGFVDGRKNNRIYTDLALQRYPTFILVDSEGKILLRGGQEEFNKIEHLIK